MKKSLNNFKANKINNLGNITGGKTTATTTKDAHGDTFYPWDEGDKTHNSTYTYPNGDTSQGDMIIAIISRNDQRDLQID